MRDAGDVFQYRNNLQRVFVTLLDGKWHGAVELQRVGGQNYAARARELREERCGNMRVECRKDPKGHGSQYRLDLHTVTKAIENLILGGKLPPRQRSTKQCPTCNGSGKVPDTKTKPIQAESFDVLRGVGFGDEPASHVPSIPLDTTRWNDVFDELAV